MCPPTSRLSRPSRWPATLEDIKRAEKRRESVTDGIPLGHGALSLGGEVASDAPGKAGLDVPLPTGDGIGQRLLAVVADAERVGQHPELALRRDARGDPDAIRERVLYGMTSRRQADDEVADNRADGPAAGDEQAVLTGSSRRPAADAARPHVVS